MSEQERIEQLERELSAARFAAKQHLQTVLVQQKIIAGYAAHIVELERVTPSGV